MSDRTRVGRLRDGWWVKTKTERIYDCAATLFGNNEQQKLTVKRLRGMMKINQINKHKPVFSLPPNLRGNDGPSTVTTSGCNSFRESDWLSFKTGEKGKTGKTGIPQKCLLVILEYSTTLKCFQRWLKIYFTVSK